MKYGIFFFFLLISPAYSALAPFYQGIQEIEAILQDPKLGKYFSSSEVIEKILREERGYILLSRQQALYVKVIPSSEKKIGPRQFSLEFSKEPFLNR